MTLWALCVGKDDVDLSADGQGIMFGYASDELEDAIPLTPSMATRLEKKLNDVRKNGELWWLRSGRSEKWQICLHGDKSMTVKRQDVEALCRLLAKHTIYELCLPSGVMLLELM